MGRPTTRPQPLVTRSIQIQIQIQIQTQLQIQILFPRSPPAASARLQVATRVPPPAPAPASAPAPVASDARISSAGAKLQLLKRRPSSGTPLAQQQLIQKRTQLSAAKTQLVPRPTLVAQGSAVKAFVENKAVVKPFRSRPQVPTKPRKTSRPRVVVPTTPRLVERPRTPKTTPKLRAPKQLPISAMRERKPAPTTPAPPPPTYIPASKPNHARDSYKEKYHTSESRVLYSLFREDIKKQMKLPSKDGEDDEETEKEEAEKS